MNAPAADRSRSITTPASADPLPSPVLRIDRTRLIGDEPARLQLVLGDDAASEPAQVTSARARALGPGAHASIAFEFDERREAELRFAGTALQDHHGWISIEVDFAYADGYPGRATTVLWSQPASQVPARFTGRVRETVRDGFAHVLIEVDVARPGQFSFYADLCDHGGERLGYVQGDLLLPIGLNEVSLRVVAERRVLGAGEYVISGMRGVSFRTERPERLFMPDFPGGYPGGGGSRARRPTL
jgi:hypothetical protein